MHRGPDHLVALERARWLAELTQAINQAQKLAWRLGVAEADVEEARELYARLEGVRAELEALRSNGWTNVRREVEPNWLERIIADGGFQPFSQDPAR